MNEVLKLENIRNSLIRQEETIIFGLIERAQFLQNSIIYCKGGIEIENYSDSFMMHLLAGTEQIHSLVRRYTSPDEHPFTKGLPQPIIKNIPYQSPIKKNDININDQILEIYIDEIIPLVCKTGDDGNYGSSSVCDVNVLQAMSKRVHYGKFVAESKFLSDEADYSKLIRNRDKIGIMEKLTNVKVEEKILDRVKIKAQTYGQDPQSEAQEYKISPDVIQKIYRDWIIPLTKDVEYQYLLRRV